MVLGYPLAFTLQFAPQVRCHACLRHRSIARDRRGLLLGRCSVNNPASVMVEGRGRRDFWVNQAGISSELLRQDARSSFEALFAVE